LKEEIESLKVRLEYNGTGNDQLTKEVDEMKERLRREVEAKQQHIEELRDNEAKIENLTKQGPILYKFLRP
jgi:regulator of replication initiation timing